MANELVKVTPDDVPNLLVQLEEAFFDIPFENSDFQNRAFVIAAQQTPARAYRALGLKMHSKIQAVKEYKFSQEKLKIDLEELEFKLGGAELDPFERRRLELDRIKKQDGQRWGEKLLNDALHELSVLQAEFEKFPRYTREQFEAEERDHFEKRLTRQLRANGAQESLLNMTEDMPAFDKRIALAIAQIAMLEHKE